MTAHRIARNLVLVVGVVGAGLMAGACASSTPAADRIVYSSETIVIRDPGIGAGPAALPAPVPAAGGAAARRTAPPVRDDVPESVRREWFEKNGPNRGYTPARAVPSPQGSVREVVRERRVYVDRGYDRCDDRRWVSGLAPLAFAVGWHHGNYHHHHSGLSYGLAYSFPFWCW